MKPFNVIREDKRITVSGIASDGMKGWITDKGNTFYFIATIGGGWDHLSVSNERRCPTWAEMCLFKDIFFHKDECCIEYHPAEKDYVNFHPYCLHIWRPQEVEIPKPPRIFV